MQALLLFFCPLFLSPSDDAENSRPKNETDSDGTDVESAVRI
jgi:hypothetical protein